MSADTWRPFRIADEEYPQVKGQSNGVRVLNLSLRRGRGEQDRAERPGGGLIRTAAVLLFALGLSLLAVSFAAQYAYVDAQRHQYVASVIEAGALDVGMVIFSLLALGLARAGLAAKAERGLIVACAAGSAVMNYAAADVTSPRSVLAFCMPPIFLAVVVDRVVVTVRRHVLGMREGRSPWAALGRITLYALRFALAPWPTATGLRRFVLTAAPLPAIPPSSALTGTLGKSGLDVAIDRALDRNTFRQSAESSARSGTKTARFLALVAERHGPLEAVPLADVSRISSELAPEVQLHAGTARSALRARVLQARGGESA